MAVDALSAPSTAPLDDVIGGIRTLGRHAQDAAAVSLLLVLVGLVSWQRLWFWNGLAYLDIPTFYLPWYAHLGESVRHLDIPGWNPYQFSGTPFAGDPQSGWWYFPAMLSFAFLDPVRAYQWLLIFHLALAGLWTYALARALGLRPLAGLVAASAYAFGPFANHISCCLIHVQLASWIPSAILGVEVATHSSRWSGRLAGWTLCGFAVSQMLAGWAGQGAYNGMLVTASYVVYRTVVSPPTGSPRFAARIRSSVMHGVAVFAIGFGLGAAGLLPRLDVVRHTNVAGGEYVGLGSDNYSSGWTFTLLLDRLMGDGHGYFTFLFYLGGPAITLALMAVVLAKRRFAAPYFVVLGAVTTILTLERITPVHRLFYLLPRFEALHEHVPTRIVAVQWIAPAMLAGITVEAICRIGTERRLWLAAAIPLALWVAVVAHLESHGRTIGVATLAVVAGICAAVALLPWLHRARSGRARTVLATALLLAVLWEPAGRAFVGAVVFDRVDPVLALDTGPVPSGAIAENAASEDPDGAGGFLQGVTVDGRDWRYYGYEPTYLQGGWGYPSTYREFYWDPLALDLLVNARAMRLGLSDVQGYNPVQLRRYVAFMEALNGRPQNYHDSQVLPGGIESPLLDLLNVRYVVVPNHMPNGRVRPDMVYLLNAYREVYRDERVRVLENPDALPRAWAVHEVREASDEEALSLLSDGTVDPRITALLPVGSKIPPTALAAKPTGDAVRVVGYEPDTVTLDADLRADGIVVLSEVYDEGWNAYVDGERVELYRADGLLRAVGIRAGTHDLELRYEPMSLRVGLGISGATAAMLGIATSIAVWLRRPRPRD